MTYYVFQNEADAVAVAQHIWDNVLAWYAANAPETLSPDGTKVRCRNAATGNWEEDVFTEHWDIPRQIQDGRYVVCKPYEPVFDQIPPETVLHGITADEEEESPDWWAST